MKKVIEDLLINQLFARKLLSGIEKFRDRHKGETCYIFGDGPSLKWFDITQFSDHCGISCGLLPFHKDFAKLDIRYCTMVEPWVFSKFFCQIPSVADFRAVTDEYKIFLMKNRNINFFLHLTSYLDVRGEHINYVFRRPPSGVEALDRLAKTTDLFGGSFHAALSLAYYLGFSKIYLLGFDAWTIQPARNMHWYELGEGIFFEPTNFARDFLQALEEKIEIYTISFDGNSRNVTRVNYQDYTGKPAQFRENHEIIDQHYLNTLATYPKYKIFP